MQKAPFCDLREIVDQTIVTFLTNCRVRQQAGDVLEDIGIKRQTAGNVRSGYTLMSGAHGYIDM